MASKAPRPFVARGRALAAWFSRCLLTPLLDYTLPTDCFACRAPLGAQQFRGACPGCWMSFRWIRLPCCPLCGDPLPEATDLLGPAGGRCPACVLAPPPYERMRAAVLYDEHARIFILRGKMGRRPELLHALGTRLGALLAAEHFGSECSVVIPVPSHPWARVRRGFDPAGEVARGVSRGLHLPLRSGWLRRRWRGAVPTKRLPARARDAAVRDAFIASGRVRGQRVLLVDDVRTTGATLSACARALRAAGAVEVQAAVWALTPLSGKRPAVRERAARL